MDDKTATYYENEGAEYAQRTFALEMASLRDQFIEFLCPEATQILDAGCGSGRDALAFHNAGYEVTAFDASATMVEAAKNLTGLPIEQLSFADIFWQNQFDGIWACADGGDDVFSVGSTTAADVPFTTVLEFDDIRTIRECAAGSEIPTICAEWLDDLDIDLGRVMDAGPVSEVVTRAQAQDLRQAFATLTRTVGPEAGA